MGVTLKEFIGSLPAKERRAIEARAAELIAEEASLKDLRKAMGKTQVEMAKTLGVGQDAVSRVEKRADMLLSTLGEYVKGMGGDLALVAEFPDRPPVRLTGLGAIAPRPSRRARSRKARASAPARKQRRSA
jgi:hypothetical protein